MQTAFPSFSSSDGAYVDLHVHSNASDGSLSALEILAAAARVGLRAVSITDHDTVDGTLEALATPPPSCVEVLSGLEISAEYPTGAMHVLGYLFDPHDRALRQTLEKLQETRAERNLRIAENLQGMGLDVTYEEVREIAVRGQVGRPHFAQALVRKGVVQTVDEAFDRYLKKGRPAYAPKYRLPAVEAIEVISRAGGVAVLAHPGSLGLREEGELEALLVPLKAAGLLGLEAHYPEHTADQVSAYQQLAARHGLVLTGGTDFHGAIKPGVHLGFGKGDLRVPYTVVEGLRRVKQEREGLGVRP